MQFYLVKVFFHGLPAAFPVLTAEQLRGDGCAYSPSCSAAWCLEEVSLQGWLRSVAPCWTSGMYPVLIL